MRPTIHTMLAFVEKRTLVPGTDGEIIFDRWSGKPLARWVDPTRIVINEDAHKDAVQHLETFLGLYRHEKVIGVSYPLPFPTEAV
jgi:Fe-S cluster biosynthesis and repair protein YggX